MVLLWNIALDENHGPNTAQGCAPGSKNCGCADCRGLLTLTKVDYHTNADFYAVAHR